MTILTVPKIASLIERDKKQKIKETTAERAAATVLQQNMLENAGKLQPVIFVGPENTVIHGYYSKEENAFLPKFEI